MYVPEVAAVWPLMTLTEVWAGVVQPEIPMKRIAVLPGMKPLTVWPLLYGPSQPIPLIIASHLAPAVTASLGLIVTRMEPLVGVLLV